MLSSQSIQLIFSSWDVIKNIPDYQQMFSDQLSEKLSDSTVAEWFSGPANPHHMVFVKMIDLIVHLLGPDLDVIIEELTAQGRRHHRYHSDMIGFFHEDSFAQIADAFVEIVRSALEEQATKDESREIRAVSVLHPNQMEAVTKSWSEIFTMIRAIMKQGVKMEARRHKKRAEKQRQEFLAKQKERRPSDETEPTIMTERDSSETLTSDCAPVTPIGQSKSKLKISPSRSAARLSAKLGSMRPRRSGSLKNSANGSSKAGVRAGLAMLNAGSTSTGKKKSSNIEKLSQNNGSIMGSNNMRMKGVRTSLSMNRMAARR